VLNALIRELDICSTFNLSVSINLIACANPSAFTALSFRYSANSFESFAVFKIVSDSNLPVFSNSSLKTVKVSVS